MRWGLTTGDTYRMMWALDSDSECKNGRVLDIKGQWLTEVYFRGERRGQREKDSAINMDDSSELTGIVRAT